MSDRKYNTLSDYIKAAIHLHKNEDSLYKDVTDEEYFNNVYNTYGEAQLRISIRKEAEKLENLANRINVLKAFNLL